MSDEPFTYSGKLAFLRRVCVDPRLQRTAVAVVAVIVDHAHRSTGRTHVSVATIVAESGVPKSTALRALRRLEELGWLSAEKRFGTSSNYTLTSATAGTGPDVGTGVIWNATGAIQNLRKGKTGPDAGAGPVPNSGHKQEDLKATGIEQAKPDASRPVDPLWGSGLAFLVRKGTPELQARSFLGKLCKQAGQLQAIALLADAEEADVVDPVSWLAKAAQSKVLPLRGGRLARDTRSEDEITAALESELAKFEARA
jgi:hypothetical protein